MKILVSIATSSVVVRPCPRRHTTSHVFASFKSHAISTITSQGYTHFDNHFFINPLKFLKDDVDFLKALSGIVYRV